MLHTTAQYYKVSLFELRTHWGEGEKRERVRHVRNHVPIMKLFLCDPS